MSRTSKQFKGTPDKPASFDRGNKSVEPPEHVSGQPHELALLFPPLGGDAFRQLVEDIRENGLMEPIHLFEGKILDGVHRDKACIAAQVQRRWKQFEGNYDAALSFVLSKNKHRRHMSAEEQSALAVKIERLRTQKGVNKKAAKELAAQIGISTATASYAQKIVESGIEELVTAVEQGRIGVHTGAKVATNLKAAGQAAFVASTAQKSGPRTQPVSRRFIEAFENNSQAASSDSRLPPWKTIDGQWGRSRPMGQNETYLISLLEEADFFRRITFYFANPDPFQSIGDAFPPELIRQFKIEAQKAAQRQFEDMKMHGLVNQRDPIDCKECGSAFIPRNTSALFCSKDCSQGAREKRRANQKLNCKKCGKVFIPTKSANQKYCSERCVKLVKAPGQKERNQRAREKRRANQKVNCKECGKVFIPTKTANQKYCSNSCLRVAKRKRQHGERHSL